MQEILNRGVAGIQGHQPVTAEDAPRVSIRHKEGPPPRVQQDGVHGFRTKPLNAQEILSKNFRRALKHDRDRTPAFFVQPVQKIPNGPRLLLKKAGRPDERFDFGARTELQPVNSNQAPLSQAHECQGSVPPGRILGQDRSQNDLQACPRRPPMLRAEGLEHSVEIPWQQETRLGLRRLSRKLHNQKSYTAVRGKSRREGERNSLWRSCK